MPLFPPPTPNSCVLFLLHVLNQESQAETSGFSFQEGPVLDFYFILRSFQQINELLRMWEEAIAHPEKHRHMQGGNAISPCTWNDMAIIPLAVLPSPVKPDHGAAFITGSV